MQYSFREVHTLNLLHDNDEYSRRFNIPIDLKLMTLIILLVVGTAITCGVIFKVDKIVPADGVLETRARLFEVRAMESGRVSELLVTEGQEVSEGQMLVRFDPHLVELEIARLQQEKETLQRSIWTRYYELEPVANGSLMEHFSAELASLDDPVGALGYQHYLRRQLDDALATLEQSRRVLQANVDTSEERLLIATATRDMVSDEVARLGRLVERGAESAASLESARKRLQELEGNMVSLSGSIRSDQAELARLAVEMEQRRNDFRVERLLQIQDELDRYRQAKLDLARQQRILSELEVVAPFAGRVDNVEVRGPGEALSEGAALLHLRPAFNEEDLQIEIEIPSNYAVWVEPGMEFRASSLGNNPDDHGYIHGRVGFVSSSSEDSEDGQRRYRMRGEITEINLTGRSVPPETFLRPGLQLSVEIKAGERRLINYLFDPFTKHLRTALSEPT